MSKPIKHSFSIKGHRTSISLEAPFWEALKQVAQLEGVPVAGLVGRIDANRRDGALSSAIRIWLLDHFRSQALLASHAAPLPDGATYPEERSPHP